MLYLDLNSQKLVSDLSSERSFKVVGGSLHKDLNAKSDEAFVRFQHVSVLNFWGY